MFKRYADVAVDPAIVLSVSKVNGYGSTMIIQPKEGQQCVVVISEAAAEAMLEDSESGETKFGRPF